MAKRKQARAEAESSTPASGSSKQRVEVRYNGPKMAIIGSVAIQHGERRIVTRHDLAQAEKVHPDQFEILRVLEETAPSESPAEESEEPGVEPGTDEGEAVG